MKYFLKYWLPVILFMILIFYFSSLSYIPQPTIVKGFMFSPEIEHIIIYAILGILMFRALKNSKNLKLKSGALLLAIAFSTIYGITDEFHQFFVPGREMSSIDLFFDMIGSSFAFFAKFFNDKVKKQKIYIAPQSLKQH